MRDEGADRQRDRGQQHLLHHLALQLPHRLLDHLHVEIEADRDDEAVLLAAQQVSGAADLHVAHGDAEAGAQLGELADGLQPLLGDFR